MGRNVTRINKHCIQCGKEFEVYLSEIKKGGGKFCSRSCATTYRNLTNNPSKNPEIRKKISENHADINGEKNPMYNRKGSLSPSYIDGRNSYKRFYISANIASKWCRKKMLLVWSY